ARADGVVKSGVFFLLGLLAAMQPAAADELRTANVVVDFVPTPPTPGWYAAGLEELVARELSRFNGLTLAEKLDPTRCPRRERRCLTDEYGRRGVNVIVLGQVGRRALDYQVLETWSGTRAADGSLAIASVTSASLRRHLGELVRPIVQHGGLLDEQPRP